MTDTPPPRSGLRAGALDLGLVAVIGVASAAPGYSLAAALGLITAASGVKMPAMLLLAFVPMACIAIAFDQFNRIDPDCGTCFSWVTRTCGPSWGWMTGWAVIAADIVVMTSLAQISAQYSLGLVGTTPIAHPHIALALGVVWIAAMTWVCYRGITFSARLQTFLLLFEIGVLLALAGVMLHAVYAEARPQGLPASRTMFWPGGLPLHAWMDAMGVAIFIYWGWDTAVNVNAESSQPRRTPGRAAILSTLALVAVFVLLGTAALCWAGPHFLVTHQDDVLAALGLEAFGAPWNKLLHVVVLTSAIAATQTTILPTARTVLSMAEKGALPQHFQSIHPVHRIPTRATLWMGVASALWYLLLSQTTTAIVAESLQALNLLVAFYYGLSGLACAWHFHRQFRGVRGFLLQVAAPFAGGVALLWVMVYLMVWPSAESAQPNPWPLLMATGMMAIGVVLMLWQRWRGTRAGTFWTT